MKDYFSIFQKWISIFQNSKNSFTDSRSAVLCWCRPSTASHTSAVWRSLGGVTPANTVEIHVNVNKNRLGEERRGLQRSGARKRKPESRFAKFFFAWRSGWWSTALPVAVLVGGVHVLRSPHSVSPPGFCELLLVDRSCSALRGPPSALTEAARSSASTTDQGDAADHQGVRYKNNDLAEIFNWALFHGFWVFLRSAWKLSKLER